jgi:hypothetical protein
LDAVLLERDPEKRKWFVRGGFITLLLLSFVDHAHAPGCGPRAGHGKPCERTLFAVKLR